jgi:hypothetical protein
MNYLYRGVSSLDMDGLRTVTLVGHVLISLNVHCDVAADRCCCVLDKSRGCRSLRRNLAVK